MTTNNNEYINVGSISLTQSHTCSTLHHIQTDSSKPSIFPARAHLPTKTPLAFTAINPAHRTHLDQFDKCHGGHIHTYADKPAISCFSDARFSIERINAKKQKDRGDTIRPLAGVV